MKWKGGKNEIRICGGVKPTERGRESKGKRERKKEKVRVCMCVKERGLISEN